MGTFFPKAPAFTTRSLRVPRIAPPLILALQLMLLASPASARTIVVFAPHPDDEVLMAAGTIRQAILSGNTVKVVVVTNGDINGTAVGYQRMAESVAGLATLGLDEDHVIFLGYGDASLRDMYRAATNTSIITSKAGQQQTYANRGLGRIDYHRYLFGVPGDYNRTSIVADIQAVLLRHRPDDIYVTSSWDDHSDHRTTCLFVIDALAGIKRGGVDYSPMLHQGMVHAPCEYCNPDYLWPMPMFTPAEAFPKPPYLDMTPLRWSDIESITAPDEMLTPVEAQNLKLRAIKQHASQLSDWLLAFVKRDEFFWQRRFDDAAMTASVVVTREWGAQTDTPVPADYDGDGRADLAVYRPSTGEWFLTQLQDGMKALAWGAPSLGDAPVPADYDGDGKADVAVYRTSTGEWFVAQSGGVRRELWGAPSLGDVPVSADYDGDGRADVAVYRSTTGEWFIAESGGSRRRETWGAPSFGDVPVPADYDGDGRADIAVYRASSGQWFVTLSSTRSGAVYHWGAPALGDVPVPADYDGDGRADIAVVRPASGEWFLSRSSDGFLLVSLGFGNARVPADFDGDGASDVAIWIAVSGSWVSRIPVR